MQRLGLMCMLGVLIWAGSTAAQVSMPWPQVREQQLAQGVVMLEWQWTPSPGLDVSSLPVEWSFGLVVAVDTKGIQILAPALTSESAGPVRVHWPRRGMAALEVTAAVLRADEDLGMALLAIDAALVKKMALEALPPVRRRTTGALEELKLWVISSTGRVGVGGALDLKPEFVVEESALQGRAEYPLDQYWLSSLHLMGTLFVDQSGQIFGMALQPWAGRSDLMLVAGPEVLEAFLAGAVELVPQRVEREVIPLKK